MVRYISTESANVTSGHVRRNFIFVICIIYLDIIYLAALIFLGFLNFNFRNSIAKVDQPIHFPYLETLDLSNNLLSLIPDGFMSHCNKLESLNLNDNQLGKQATALKQITFSFLFLISMLLCLTEKQNPVSEMLPSERESAKLEHLSSLYLNNNQLTGREPFYVPKFVLELPRY